MPHTFFMYTYAPLPTLWSETLVTLLLPCFHMETVQNSSATMQCFGLPSNLHATSFRSLLHMVTQKFFNTIPLLTFLALAFTMVNLLLLCNLNFPSSMLVSWLSFGHQTDMRAFYVTPAFLSWFIVVSSIIQLFSFLNRSSLIPTMPTKFHQQLQAWIHSMPVTQSPSPSLWRHYMSWVPPKIPLQLHQSHH